MKVSKITHNKLVLLLVLLIFNNLSVNAQCMLIPISLEQRIENSSLIVEGIVEDELSVWDNNHRNIYTVYTIEPTALFKGNFTGSKIKVVELGGQVGLERHDVSNTISLSKNKAALFTLQISNKPVNTLGIMYECYAGVQGVINYDAIDRSGAGVFDKYTSVEQHLYPILQSKTGKQRQILKAIDWPKLGFKTNSNELALARQEGTEAITSFSPTSINAGNNEILTITGSGFGSTQGTSYVQFKNANDGGATWMTPVSGNYISWSDSEIKIYVPTGAGTGQIRVVASSTQTSSTNLTINYNLTNVTYNNAHYFPKLANDNGSGGYTFTYFTDFSTTSNAVTYFTKSITDWNCNSGVNFRISNTTSAIDVIASDGVNIVRFDNGTELGTGTLGQATVRSSGCIISGVAYWYVGEIDMVFDDGTNWYYGTGTPGSTQYDFYSVVLHELGHAHLQGHAINSGTMMHYSISNGATARNFSSTQETAAAARAMTLSTGSGNCTSTAMTSWSACSTPNVSLSTGATTIAENAGSTTVTATLSSAYVAPVTVSIGTSGTATFSTDYSLSSSSITIPAGSTSASITLTAIDDAVFEGDETVIMDIIAVTNGTESGTQQKTVTITENDAGPNVTLTTGAATIAETGGTTAVTATLSAASPVSTVVTFTLSGTATVTTDYTLTTSITIPAGSTSGSATLSAVSDVLDEDNETVIIDINTVTNGTENGTQQKTVSITDDDATPSVTLSTGVITIAEPTGSTSVTAALSAVSGRAVTVNLSHSGTATTTTDYTLATTITIPAGSSSASITLAAVDDVVDEPAETVIIDITSVTNGTENGTQQKIVTITDDDEPLVTLTTNTTTISENAGSANVIINLSSVHTEDVYVDLALSGTATVDEDFTLVTSVVVPAGSTYAIVPITGILDILTEGNETVKVDIASVDYGYEDGEQQLNYTITDVVVPTVHLTTNSATILENGGTANVIVNLSGVYVQDVTVNLGVSGTATSTVDYTLATSVTIPAGSTYVILPLTAIQDALDEDNETISIEITSVTNGNEDGVQQMNYTITDDDDPAAVTISTNAVTVNENGGVATVSFNLSAVSGKNITVAYSTSGTATLNSDYTISPSSTITIPAGSNSATVAVTGINDGVSESNETVVLDIATVTNGIENGTQQQIITILESSVLPVRFSGFTAAINDCKAQLNFTTATEQNSNHFEVEWSVDGLNWRNIESIPAKGNSNTTQVYKSVHSNPATGSNFYRIKQIDNDGRITYSNVVIVKSSCNDVRITVLPNPFANQVTVSGITNNSTIKLFDAKGKLIKAVNNAIITSSINTESLATGNYYLLIVDKSGNSKTISLVKQ
jgi:hypothetical protein